MTSMIHCATACEVVKRLHDQGITLNPDLFCQLIAGYQNEHRRVTVHVHRIQEYLRRSYTGKALRLEELHNRFLDVYNQI